MELLQTYYRYVLDNTESPVTVLRWSLLTMVGALLSRNVYFKLGHFTVYPNLFINIVGEPASRKTSAINIIMGLLKDVGYTTVATGKTSKEKFLEDLHSGFNYNTCETIDDLVNALNRTGDKQISDCLIAHDEFTNFIGQQNYDFASLLGELYDSKSEHPVRMKHGKSFVIKNPQLSILAGNTHTGLSQAFPPELLGQGFFSRMLFIHGDPTGKRITFPEDPDMKLKKELVDGLNYIKSMEGRVSCTPGAAAYLDKVYKAYPMMQDYRFKHYHSRRLTHLIKIAMCVAACMGTTEITEAIAVYANTLLAQAEIFMPKALSEYGKGKFSETAGKIVQLLDDDNGGLTLQEIFKRVHQDLDNGMLDLVKIVRSLEEAEKIVTRDGKFYPQTRVESKVEDFVDFSILE